MTERGKLVFGAAIGTPLFYLFLVTCYRFFPGFPGVGLREIMNGDLWMAAAMFVGVLILATFLTKLDPDLRSQTLLTPEPVTESVPVAPVAEGTE